VNFLAPLVWKMLYHRDWVCWPRRILSAKVLSSMDWTAGWLACSIFSERARPERVPGRVLREASVPTLRNAIPRREFLGSGSYPSPSLLCETIPLPSTVLSGVASTVVHPCDTCTQASSARSTAGCFNLTMTQILGFEISA